MPVAFQTPSALSLGRHGLRTLATCTYAQKKDQQSAPKPRPKPVVSFPGRDGRIAKAYTLRVMQWNIDFNTDNVFSRTSHLIRVIGEEKPDVIFLQEVSAIESGPRGSSFDLIKKKLVDSGVYYLLTDDLVVERHPFYFAVMLIRRRIVSRIEPEYVRFPYTKMARHLIIARVNVVTEVGEDRICLLTCHLESLPSGIRERVTQFDQILKTMREENAPCIFGGDTNLRSREIRLRDVRQAENEKVALPDDVFDPKLSDAWVQIGSPEEHKFSWDARRNDNKEWLGDVRPYARFDRIFSFPGTCGDSRRPRAITYRLVGTERGPTDQFPSDHFGIVADFNMTLPFNDN
eukprot:CAMPEP_0198728528 /NCGR_PEP_ID=MMETSP1475-20131203/9916_1 /TAXON_ID= ORGANISM="Unidentified sp., Strain CCMP1999" /NCGR_SAMPLE_ID=MMETSP1475 /ASSEMBLY_ACC=CAM_ASM_001111 /LENGTH=346 /DNA_ID=CAMNT_0044490927 /DNA_START=33 /DNA_END=1071 /DNA_ORIENTATION=-